MRIVAVRRHILIHFGLWTLSAKKGRRHPTFYDGLIITKIISDGTNISEMC